MQFEQLAQDQAASLATAQERQNELVAQVLALQQEVQEREQQMQVCSKRVSKAVVVRTR